MVPVQFQDGLVAWLPETALEEVPAVAPALTDRFASGRFVDPDWLRRTLARIRVTGRLNDVVYSMEATGTDFFAFQFKPVLKLLNSPTDALLIADEVGLGKTIEAGLIWTELRARLQSNRFLVLCPKTLCEKWRRELDHRFGVDARIVDASELIQLLSSTTRNGRGFAAIASMQALRPPRGWDDLDETGTKPAESPRRRLARLLDDASDGAPLIDLLVIDEAHHMRNPQTMLYLLAKLVNAVATYRVFLSATPIHLRSRDLHSLLRLIDPDMFEYESTLDELILVNAPIVEARDLLMKPTTTVATILERLEAAQQHDLIADSRALALLREELKSKPLDQTTRAELASRLEHVNQLANYVTRTRRRDVDEFRVKRDAKAPTLVMHADERIFYDHVTAEVADYAYAHSANERFLLSTPQRLLSSSPAAASEYWAAFRSEQNEPVEETDDDLQDGEDNDRPLVARLAVLSRNLNMTARLEQIDTKYNLLLEQFRQIWADESDAKIIVFSSFKPTLHYLRRRLVSHGVHSELLHGSVTERRDSILTRFREHEESKVLLSSDIGSEGVDLQFCSIVINYDLPWNPMRLEQRVGRVDRLGQSKPKVTLLNFVYEGTIDDRIYRRLYERLGLGERALGEFEAVLGEPIREMTQKLVDPTLTDEQKTDAIDWAAQAVANLRHQEAQLEAEAGSLIRHGDFILQKIMESRELHRWLRPGDIMTYVVDRIRRSFSGCSIEASPPGSQTCKVILSTPARDALATFIARHGLRGTTRLLEGHDQQRFQFTSSVIGSADARVESISQVHPLVRFAAELDRVDDASNRAEPVAASVRRKAIKFDCMPGLYVLAVRRWLGISVDGRGSNSARLAYAGARSNPSGLLSAEVAESMFVAAAEHGQLLLNMGTDERIADATAILSDCVLPELDRRFGEFDQQLTAEVEDRAAIRRRALERHQRARTETLTTQLNRLRERVEFSKFLDEPHKTRQLTSLVVATEVKLRRLQESFDLRFKEIETQRDVMPEEAEVAFLFLEVTG